MPELPEVETTLAGITPHIQGQRIKQITVRQPRLRWPVPENIASCLAGQTVVATRRRGKYMLFQFKNGVLMIHLGMSGHLRLMSIPENPGIHDHVDIEFSHGYCLRYCDPRRFGSLHWVEGCVDQHPLLRHLGPEPLTEAFNGAYLYEKSRKRSVPIKSFLMNSRIVVGVGNIYANEALFNARLRPLKGAKRVTKSQYAELATQIKSVLSAAIAQGGTTLRDFVDSRGQPGYFAQKLNVYGRADQPCLRCETVLKAVRLADRQTVYCPVCQK